MISPLPLDIRWIEWTEEFCHWLAHHPMAVPRVLNVSREATIWTLAEAGASVYVIKHWKPDCRANARANYRLLHSLHSSGLPVASPAGWGFDRDGAHALAMEYAGDPVDRASRADIEAFGRTLGTIHAVPLDTVDLMAPADSSAFFERLRGHFFDDVDGQPDLAALLYKVRVRLPPLDTVLIHGDYHLGNVARGPGVLSVLDWSDAQLGDWRYDLAWAALLTLIYTGAGAQDTFLQAYVEATGRNLDEGTRPYEIVAAIRWLLLSRTAPFPVPAEWQQTAEAFLRSRLTEN